jgi:tellurite resistance protein TerA
MKILERGQKTKLSELECGSVFDVKVALRINGGSLDLSCFGLDAADKLSDDRYMIFYNQLSSPESAIRLNLTGDGAVFEVNLDALPVSINKLVFTGAIDGNGTMRELASGSLNLGHAASFGLSGSDFADEKAIIIGELYRRDGSWRFGAVGQGFNGGLSALLSHFGGSESSAPASAAPAATLPESKKVSLSKITLEKRGDKVSLEKKRDDQGFGRIRVNLNWNQRPAPAEKTGFFSRMIGNNKASSAIDLDLGCLFELADGRKGGVQALGESWGNFERAPYIYLDGDDRSGAVSTGENLYINGDAFEQIRRILVFTFIYDGVPNWGETDGVVTIEVPGQPTVEVKLDNGGMESMCGIAMIENIGGQLQVTKLIDYIPDQNGRSGHAELDRRYNFGLRWTTGSKD